MRAFDCRPRREKENRAVWRQRNFRDNSSICEIVRPEAYKPPTRAPAEAPAIASIGIAFSSSARSTPACAPPRGAPREGAGRGRGGVGLSGGGILGVFFGGGPPPADRYQRHWRAVARL